MTFEQARAELKDIAGGEYRALYYELAEGPQNPTNARCRVYVNPYPSEAGDTWREALDLMRVTMGLDEAQTADTTEAPQEG